MKVVEGISRDVVTGGGGEMRAITIAANGTIIRNTIKSIYSNKERTITRELMANGFDAHIAAGLTDMPLKVYLPTHLDPVFSVRDYGVGMSHEFVMDHYSSLGFSTKSDSNTQTGMFGVGSKSPLSISDSFTVRCLDKPDSVHPNGRIRLYTIFFDSEGNPQLQHTFDVTPRPEDEIERGGTEVKVPISPSNREAIIAGLAEQQFAWFDQAVTFDGAVEQAEGKFYKAITPVAEGFYVARLREKNRYASSLTGKIFVRQGSAVYPLDESQLTRSGVSSEEMGLLRSLTSSDRHVMIDLPIGTADVTMARESLQYNDATIANLKREVSAALQRFSTVLESVITEDVTSFPKALEALSGIMLNSPEERDSLAHIQSLSALLPLVRRKVQSNYDVYHAALPKVTQRRPVLDANGDITLGADGTVVTEEYDEDPPYHVPRLNATLSASSISDGKVLLATGSVYRSYGKVELDVTTGVSRLDVTFPNVFYVIPSHLNRWQDRIKKHAETYFDGAELADRKSEGLSVYIIRVARKGIDRALAEIAARQVDMLVFIDDDLPELLDSSGKVSVAYSRTAVYRWSSSGWDRTKVEPDYSKPAYYVARAQLTNECYGPQGPSRMTPYTGKLTPRHTLSESSVSQTIYAAQKRLIDRNTPIYRVTEKQYAALKEDKTSPWIDLMTTLAYAAESERVESDLRAVMDSRLVTSYNCNTYVDTLRSAMRHAVDSPLMSQSLAEEALRDLKVIQRLMAMDSSFSYMLAVRYYLTYGGKISTVAQDHGLVDTPAETPSDTADILLHIFGRESLQSSSYDKTESACQRVFEHLQAEYAVIHSVMPAMPREHVLLYLDGVTAAGGHFRSNKERGTPLTTDIVATMSILDGFVSHLTKKLDSRSTELYTYLTANSDEMTRDAA